MDVKRETICRTCLEYTTDLQYIFDVSAAEVPIIDMIRACTTVSITSADTLPLHICKTCIYQLSIAYNFKLKCEKTDQILRSPSTISQGIKDVEQNVQGAEQCDSNNQTEPSDNIVKKEVQSHNDEKTEAEVNNFMYQKHEAREGGLQESIKYDTAPSTCEKENFVIHSSIYTDERSFVCTICYKIFEQEFHLREHEQYYHEEGGKEFSRRHELRAHVKTRKVKAKPFPCQKCSRTFVCPSALRSHYNSKHAAKRYSCDVCGRKFAKMKAVRVHMRNHIKQKPYSSGLCPMEFTQKNSDFHLTRYRVCREDLNRKTNLKRQNRMPFKCDVCQKAFTHFGHLSDHIRSHTEEKSFTQSAQRGKKSYICQICGKYFATTANFGAHMRSHREIKGESYVY